VSKFEEAEAEFYGRVLPAFVAPRQQGKTQTQSCARGEHLHETGRRTCRLCGADL
jgi:hypothetical protein